MTASQVVKQTGTETECVVRLEDGGILEGSVVDGAGHPLARVPVTILATQEALPRDSARNVDVGPSDVFHADVADRTATDGNGSYRLEGV